MTSVIALVILVVLAYFVVIAGGIAFESTGMDREMARFQALSAFTGTGFTTQVAEQVVEHRVRRRIASTLIVLGWAGAASVLATMIRSLYVDSALKGLGNLALGLALAGLSVLAIRRFSDEIVSAVRRVVMRQVSGLLVPQEDLLRVDGGLGLSRIEVPEHSRVLGRSLKDLHLRGKQISIVLIERHHHAIVPDADSVLEPKDHVVVFGRLDQVQAAFTPLDDPASAK
ncbi:MAG: TrkA C-terminal domain-containing protein [Proteobacteria bacterium]|nr:TrkA C-terminal domain-containing protein [Pseudomonadota bacterium]